jgi:hypothetical protein
VTEFKKGDRVTATIEAEVLCVVGEYADLRVLGVGLRDMGNLPLSVLEKIVTPLPTTHGSVLVHRSTGYKYARHRDGTWVGLNSPVVKVEEEEFGSNWPTYYDVEHDASKAS